LIPSAACSLPVPDGGVRIGRFVSVEGLHGAPRTGDDWHGVPMCGMQFAEMCTRPAVSGLPLLSTSWA
jgi:hypothetical protein